MTKLRGLFIFLALGAATACQRSDEQSCAQPTMEHFQKLIEARYVTPFKSGDTETWLTIFSPQATALHNRVPAFVGRDAIANFGKLVAGTFEVLEMQIVVEEVDASGQWAYTRGSYVSHFADRATGASAPWGREEGKFLMLWECEEPIGWRIRIDMGNSNG